MQSSAASKLSYKEVEIFSRITCISVSLFASRACSVFCMLPNFCCSNIRFVRDVNKKFIDLTSIFSCFFLVFKGIFHILWLRVL